MDATNYRTERIERLLRELEYEVVRGMMERELPETMTFQFFVPISNVLPDGVVMCEFRTKPRPRYEASLYGEVVPKLKLIVSNPGD